MEDTPLVGAYRRYKAGTKKLIQWLVDSGSARDGADTSHPTTKQKKGPISQVTRKIRVDELIPLAHKIIAAKDPTVDIPLSILDCAKDTITGRQQSALWYSDKGDNESNSTHRYFLTTLEHIFDLLKRETKSRRPKRKKKIELATDSIDLGNIFLHLDLEDPSIGENEKASSGVPVTPPRNQQRVELELSKEDIENDKRFAVWCMMDDFFKIREHVRGTWQQYKRGDLSLSTTCEITNRAIEIMCLTARDVINDHPTLVTWKDMLNCIGYERYVRNARNVEPWLCFSKDHEHARPSATCHSNRLCMPAWCALQDFRSLCCWYRNRNWNSTKTAYMLPIFAFPGHPFAEALLNITAELVELAPSCRSIPDLDIYTNRLLAIAGDECTTFTAPTLVTTQIYMDIWDALGGQTERGMLEASATFARAAETSHRWENFAKSCYSMENERQRAIRMDVSGGRKVKFPHRCKVDQTHGRRTGWTYLNGDDPVFIPSNVLATLPVLCGTLAFREQTFLGLYGSRVCDANQFVLAAAHLYKAATIQGSLDVKWDDMDFIVARQNTRGSFVRDAGERESVEAVAKQYCLALGVPLVQVAGKRHPVIPSDRVCTRNAAKMHLTSAWLLAIISEMDVYTPFRFFFECARSYVTFHENTDTTFITQWERTKRLTPCQMLFVVQEVLVEEELYTGLDLYRFTERAIDFTMDYCDAFMRLEMQKMKPNAAIANRWPMPYVLASEILWEAASVEVRGGNISQTALHRASRPAKARIESHGQEGIRQATPLSSGSIPDDQKPAARYHNSGRLGNLGSYLGKFEAHYNAVFESKHIATRAETEILQEATMMWTTLFSRKSFAHADVDDVVRTVSLLIDHKLRLAGLQRYVHVTIGEDLTPAVRSIGQSEWDTYNGPEPLRHLDDGLFTVDLLDGDLLDRMVSVM